MHGSYPVNCSLCLSNKSKVIFLAIYCNPSETVSSISIKMTESEAAKKAEEAKMLAELMAEDQMCEEAPRVFTWILTGISILLVIITAPLSLLFVLKVVQVGIDLLWSNNCMTIIRNMRRLWYSDWDASWEEVREVLGSSSSCPARISLRLWTWESRTGLCHHRRWSPGTSSSSS